MYNTNHYKNHYNPTSQDLLKYIIKMILLSPLCYSLYLLLLFLDPLATLSFLPTSIPFSLSFFFLFSFSFFFSSFSTSSLPPLPFPILKFSSPSLFFPLLFLLLNKVLALNSFPSHFFPSLPFPSLPFPSPSSFFHPPLLLSFLFSLFPSLNRNLKLNSLLSATSRL